MADYKSLYFPYQEISWH